MRAPIEVAISQSDYLVKLKNFWLSVHTLRDKGAVVNDTDIENRRSLLGHPLLKLHTLLIGALERYMLRSSQVPAKTKGWSSVALTPLQLAHLAWKLTI